MAEFVGIVGKTGTGKSTSYGRFPELVEHVGLDPKETVIINISGKPLPFKGWMQDYNPDVRISDGGNYSATSNHETISKIIDYVSENRPDVKSIILEDAQYMLAFEFMNRASETGYKKFTDIGVHFNQVRKSVMEARRELKVFALWHPDINEQDGSMKMKTVGNITDKYLTPEGLFTVILYTKVEYSAGSRSVRYEFVTNNDGVYPAKSPIGMFSDLYIPNDLGKVVKNIDKYYEV